MFESIAGYDLLKEKLSFLINAYKNEKLLNNPNVNLPKGFIFFGTPGNGKSLFISELIKGIDAKVFYVNGDGSNPKEEIQKIFDEAKKYPFSIVAIDELDLLLDEDYFLQRVLLSCIDGIEKIKNVLVLASTNYIERIDDKFFRTGRLEIKVQIDNPNEKSREEIFKFYAQKLGIKGLDFCYISKITAGVSCSDISAILNRAYIEGNGEVTTSLVEKTKEEISQNLAAQSERKNDSILKRVSVHEAGHTLMTLFYSNYLDFYKATINPTNGEGLTTSFYNENVDFELQNFYLADVYIALAGQAAEKFIYGIASICSSVDIHEVSSKVNFLIKECGCFGIQKIKNINEHDVRTTSEYRLKMQDKQFCKILKKASKKVEKIIRKNRNLLLEIANIIFEKGCFNKEDVSLLKNKIRR